jgi:hypothetical protein
VLQALFLISDTSKTVFDASELVDIFINFWCRFDAHQVLLKRILRCLSSLHLGENMNLGTTFSLAPDFIFLPCSNDLHEKYPAIFYGSICFCTAF